MDSDEERAQTLRRRHRICAGRTIGTGGCAFGDLAFCTHMSQNPAMNHFYPSEDEDEDEDVDSIEEMGVLAKICHLSNDRRILFFTYNGSSISRATSSAPFTFSIGDTVLVDSNTSRIQLAPEGLQPREKPWIGVIRLILPDVLIVESEGRLHRIPADASSVEYQKGNTVELTSKTLLRKLDDKPIRILDNEESSQEIVERFRANPPKLAYEDIGGIQEVVSRARELIEFPLTRPQIFARMGVRMPKGILFTGPAGTGKTLLARTIASNTSATFYNINGPEIMSKWYGQSERVLRTIFEDAESQKRSIIFFDEIDSIAGQRAGDSHDATRRVVAQLLTLIDGFESKPNVIVLAATNRPEDIDVALRRPGRFDSELQFPYPNEAGRRDILVTTSRGKNVASDLPFDLLARSTDGWSGAELDGIWTEAALLSIRDERDVIMAEDILGGMNRLAARRQLA